MTDLIKKLESKIVSFPYPTAFDVHEYVKLNDVKELLAAINYTRCCETFYCDNDRDDIKKETTKQCDIHVVVKQGELLSCGSCKGTDLRKKGDNYYVCNYCGNTMTT